jgi:hypothetical protein
MQTTAQSAVDMHAAMDFFEMSESPLVMVASLSDRMKPAVEGLAYLPV